MTFDRWFIAGVTGVAAVLFPAASARAILFADFGDPAHHATAPTGVYEDSGWQYLGYFGAFMGTAIAPQYFLTAQHIGPQGGTFSQPSNLTGGDALVYTVNADANGGLGFWDIAGSDLRVYQINESFSTYAPLYTGLGVGQEAVLTGRGGVRGDAVFEGGTLKGYEHTVNDGVARWGTNTISAMIGVGAGTQWVAEFNDLPGPPTHEAGLSVGDSGGGLFVNEGGVWKLAGVNFAIEGDFDTNAVVGDDSEFRASLFDRGGFYQGSDATTWTLQPDLPVVDSPSRMYFSSVAANAAAIQSIIAVPEPGSAVLVLMAGGLMGRRRSVKRSPREKFGSK